MPSFDIISEPDMHEVKNATDQVERELQQRYDFRGTGGKIEKTEEGFLLSANSEERVKAIYDVLQDKFLKRKLSLKFLSAKDIAAAGGSTHKQQVVLKKGIEKEQAKSIVQLIKSNKNLKVTPSIQGEAVRVVGKKKDDLQEVMAMLKEQDLPIEISFGNFRD